MSDLFVTVLPLHNIRQAPEEFAAGLAGDTKNNGKAVAH